MLLRPTGLRRLACATLLLLASCSRPAPREETGTGEANRVAQRSEQAVIAENQLDREDVILAALDATTAAALGKDDHAAQAQLKGRKFEVRLRFGCPGMSKMARSLAYDDKEQVLRAKVSSDLAEQPLPMSDLLYRTYEGGVGFVLGQPWLLSAGCPQGDFAKMISGQPTIVLAQLFTADESRAQRPGGEYALTKPMEPEEVPKEGLDLIVSGRLTELADGRSIHCGARDGAPVCLVAGKIDRVAFTRPGSDQPLGEWGLGLGPAR
jgi:hypothetical protein